MWCRSKAWCSRPSFPPANHSRRFRRGARCSISSTRTISPRRLSHLAQADCDAGLRLNLLEQIRLFRARQIHVDVLLVAAAVFVDDAQDVVGHVELKGGDVPVRDGLLDAFVHNEEDVL